MELLFYSKFFVLKLLSQFFFFQFKPRLDCFSMFELKNHIANNIGKYILP